VRFHEWLLDSPARTKEPAEAALFYVPVYSTCEVTMRRTDEAAKK
jgi:hypothetical protein